MIFYWVDAIFSFLVLVLRPIVAFAGLSLQWLVGLLDREFAEDEW